MLVEGRSEESEHLLVGRHQGQAPEIDGMVYINDGLAYPGEFVTLEVTQAADYDLVGTVIERLNPKDAPALIARDAPPTTVRVSANG